MKQPKPCGACQKRNHTRDVERCQCVCGCTARIKRYSKFGGGTSLPKHLRPAPPDVSKGRIR